MPEKNAYYTSEVNTMIDVGRLCIKIAGRDAGKKVVVINQLEGNFVMIDGQVKRRRCNISHLEPMNTILTLKKNATHEDVKKEFAKLNIELRESKPKEKKSKPEKQQTKKQETQKDNKPKK